MSFEAEVIPMFIAGCIAVSLMEFAVGWLVLKRHPEARRGFVGHVLMMALGLFFLVKCIFGDRLRLVGGIASIDHSVSIGLFGLFWFASVLFLLGALSRLAGPSEDNRSGR